MRESRKNPTPERRLIKSAIIGSLWTYRPVSGC